MMIIFERRLFSLLALAPVPAQSVGILDRHLEIRAGKITSRKKKKMGKRVKKINPKIKKINLDGAAKGKKSISFPVLS